MTDTQRNTSYLRKAIHNTVASAEEIDLSGFAGGRVICGSGISVTSIAIHERDPFDGTYYPAKNENGTALTITSSASGSFTLPVDCFAMDKIKLVPSTSGDDGEDVTIVLKS